MKKNVTIYDVAAHSGVSVASVSRVLARSKYPVARRDGARRFFGLPRNSIIL